MKLHTNHNTERNLLRLNLKTNTNKPIGYIVVAFNAKTGTAMLDYGRTFPNFRKSNRKYGTFLRALATKLALKEPNTNTVLHEGVNREELVAKTFGLNAETLRTIAIGTNARREKLVKKLGLDKNTVNRIRRNYVPISTKIVRKLGFKTLTNQTAGNRPVFASMFNVGMNRSHINAAINQFLRPNTPPSRRGRKSKSRRARPSR